MYSFIDITMRKITYVLNSRRGDSEYPILFIVVILGLVLVGGLIVHFTNGQIVTNTPGAAGPTCCDSGDGAACKPLVDTTHPALTYNNQTYGLLKSSVRMSDPCHIAQTTQLYQGKSIFVNQSEEIQGECGGGNGSQDQIDTGNCTPIPNDEIVYVCVSNCYSTPASFRAKLNKDCGDSQLGTNFPSYGDDTTVWATYFRTTDYPNPGIPKAIAYCQPYISKTPNNGAQQAAVPSGPIVTPYPSHQSLQLHTFTFANSSSSAQEIDSNEPYCKPAIYLYPQKQEAIHVQISSKEPIRYSLPLYPANGWDVIGNPTGDVVYNKTRYDYLYYETFLPDSVLPKEDTGYVVAYNDLAKEFDDMLPKLGLNKKESQEFSTYWIKALPYAKYYKIAIIPQSFLDSQVPLLISPRPDSVLRISVAFQPLDSSVSITKPNFSNFTRKGFTVVEWAGLYKKNKDHPFTCLQ